MALASSLSALVPCILLLVFFVPVSASRGSLQPRSVFADEYRSSIMVPWRRVAAESQLTSNVPSGNNSLVLAAERTHRIDPLANYDKYTGGWNISDQHYWASMAFTAVPLLVIAVAWFIGFGLVMLIISCRFCFCRTKSFTYSPASYFISLVLLIIFTCLTIAGCVILHCGQGMFHRSTISTVDYVIGQGNLTVDTLRNFSSSLAAAKTIGVEQIFLPATIQENIDLIEEKLNSSANEFSTRSSDNSKKIKNVLNNVQYYLIFVGALMLGLAALGFLFSIFGLQFLVSLLVIIGWIILACTFVMCGIFLLLHNVVSDTCVAMDDWVTHPKAHSALDDILPCVDVATANESMYRSREVTAQLVELVNNVIVNISNKDFPPTLQPLYYNQSGPLMPVLCNPYMPDMSNRTCAPEEVDFDTALQVWKRYECQIAGAPGSEVCATGGRVTPVAYEQMTAAANISQGLYQYGPFLMQLQDCTFVRETFTAISRNNCPGLERYSKHVYIGLVLVSAAVTLSLVFWMVHVRQRRRRTNSRQL